MSKVALLAIAASVVAMCGNAADKPSLQELRARADVARGQDCAEVCLEAAQSLVEDADRLFTQGDVDHAQAAIKDAVQYARKATDGSIQSNKRQKKTEIGLRKLSKRLTDIRQTLAVDDRPAVDEDIMAVEKMRTDLLMSMFNDKK